MIRRIVTSTEELSKLCTNMSDTSAYSPAIKDLIDTANAHKEKCVGLAANQIGYNARCFVMKYRGKYIPIIEPEYMLKSPKMKWCAEGCLSFPNRPSQRVRRHKQVKISYYCLDKEARVSKVFNGFEAQVV